MTERPLNARLVLEDGSEHAGVLFGASHNAAGEVVFATGMVGYTESLTDPSYRRQILVLTYPLAGNYGVPARVPPGLLPPPGFESERIQVAGLIVATLAARPSHWSAVSSLADWLGEEGVPGICGIDTRALTKRLRERGTMAGKILVDAGGPAQVEGGGGADAVTEQSPFPAIGALNLAAEVSTPAPVLPAPAAGAAALSGGPARPRRVVLVDCGVKAGIIRGLLARGVEVLRVPWDADPEAFDADGVVVSNGPGDPARVEAAVTNLRRTLSGTRPLLGICLGNQLVARAAGGSTYRLPFGHRGQNQPCLQKGTRRCHLTSQNHGYAVDAARLPDGWIEWFTNANDGSNEGLRHCERPFFTVQFHPEASPGPWDTAHLFDDFVRRLGGAGSGE